MINNSGEYILGGEKVTLEDIEKLTPKQITDAANTPASELEVIYIRSRIHNISDILQSISGNMELLRESFDNFTVVEVSNGDDKKHPRKLNELVVELWERDAPGRRRKELLISLKKNRIVIVIILIAISIFSILISPKIFTIYEWIKNNPTLTITGVALPVIVMMIKKLFFK